MYAFLVLIIFLSSIPVSLSSSFPNRNYKSQLSTLHHHASQEYLEVSGPIPRDQLIPSCSLPILHHSFANTVGSPPTSVPYSPPNDCPPPWSRVVLDFRATCRGEQYDRIAGLWLGGVELLRTSTAEPTEKGIFWNVQKDISKYSSLLSRWNLKLTMMLENVVNDVFTGVYHVNVTFLYYNDNDVRVPSNVVSDLHHHRQQSFENSTIRSRKPLGGANILKGPYDVYGEAPADLIIPISEHDYSRGFWFRIESEADVHSKRIQIPNNTRRGVLELYVSFHGNDEFWYSNPPSAYLEMNYLATGRGNGAYREVFVTIDGQYVASVVPFPVIFTGGINPLFWGPVVAIGAFNLPSYDFDLTPFLGQLLDGKSHRFSIGVADGISFWLVDANLHLWVDHCSTKVQASSVRMPTHLKKRVSSKFLGPDGSFKIVVKRERSSVGWVNSEEGNFTTRMREKIKFKNMIKFQRNGAYKTVKQKIKTSTEVTLENGMGIMIASTFVNRKYPLSMISSTQYWDKDMYSIVTNVSHSLEEKITDAVVFESQLQNSQDSGGWMNVKDHSVLAGEANTQQSFTFGDGVSCYSRTVAASNGQLVTDDSTFCCESST